MAASTLETPNTTVFLSNKHGIFLVNPTAALKSRQGAYPTLIEYL